jgi:isoleucyl-tRNA synthetase
MSTWHPYPQVDQQAQLPDVELAILDFWERDGTFRASVEQHPQGPEEYVFYDGPPFANGLPHYGHLLTGFLKDAVPRCQTMRGHRVERRFGWDCHGLPAEMEAENQLGVAGRREVIGYGIERFTDYCRTSVLRYAGEWRAYVTRQQTLARDLVIAAGPIAEGRRGELPDGRAVRIGLQAVRVTPERESS